MEWVIKLNPRVITDEDLKLVRISMIYPLVLDVLERDIKIIKESKLKYPVIYMMKLKDIQNKISLDAYEIRVKMRNNGIKIFEEKRTVKSLDVGYVCRGYRQPMSILWEKVNTEVQLLLCKYLEIDIADEKLRWIVATFTDSELKTIKTALIIAKKSNSKFFNNIYEDLIKKVSMIIGDNDRENFVFDKNIFKINDWGEGWKRKLLSQLLIY